MFYQIVRVAQIVCGPAQFQAHCFRDANITAEPALILLGKLVTEKSPDWRILLDDGTGSIPVEFTSFHHEWIGQTVCIVKWNLVPTKVITSSIIPSQLADTVADRCIEILCEPWIVPGDHCIHHLSSYSFSSFDISLPPDDTSAWTPSESATLKILKSTQPATLLLLNIQPEDENYRDRIQQIRKRKTVNVHGRVLAKSSFLARNDQAYFLIEILCSERGQSLSAFVLFEDRGQSSGMLWAYYQAVQIDKHYVLVNMSTKQAKLGEDNDTIRKILTFSFSESSIYPINENALCKLVDASSRGRLPLPPNNCKGIARSDNSTVTGSPPKQHMMSVVLSYIGKITQVIDAIGGLYELDGAHELYMTYYPSPSFGGSLRVGAKVRLHNVHMLVRECYEKLISRRKAVFAACMYSTVEVIEFSSFPTEGYIVSGDLRNQIRQKWSGLNLADLIVLSDLKTSLERAFDAQTETAWHRSRISEFDIKKWSLTLAKSIIKQSGFSEYREKESNLSAALNHSEVCKLANLRYPKPNVITIRDVYNFIDDELCRQDEHRNVNENFRFRTIRKDDFGIPNAVLVGFMDVDRSGNLRLTDASHSIPIVFELNEQNVTVDSLYSDWIILHFDIIVEMVGTLRKVYLRSSTKECRHYSQFVRSFPRIKKDFKQNMILFTPLYRGPTSARFNPSSNHALVGYLEGIAWLVEVSNVPFASVDSLKLLSDSSFTVGEFRDLSVWPAINNNDLYLLSNVRVTKFDSGGKVELSFSYTENSSCERVKLYQGDVFDVEEGLKRVDGINKVHLDPGCYPELCIKEQKPLIMSVRELIDLIQQDSDPALASLISVEGIVVAKEFRNVREAWALQHRIDPCELFIQSNIGIGRFDRCLHLRLGDSNDVSQTIDAYIDLQQYNYPLGAIPGSRILLERVRLVVWSRNFPSLASVPETVIRPTSNEFAVNSRAINDKAIVVADYNRPKAPRCRLFDFVTNEGENYGGELEVLCTITHIHEIILWCECAYCFARMLEDVEMCPNCSTKSTFKNFNIKARAKFYVEDGTFEATVELENYQAVMRLLNLQEVQVRQLETMIRRGVPQVDYAKDPPWFAESGLKSMMDDILQDDADSSPKQMARSFLVTLVERIGIIRSCRILCRHSGGANAKKAPTTRRAKGEERSNFWYPENCSLADDGRSKLIRISDRSTLPTFSYQRLYLRGIWVEEIDPCTEIKRLLPI
jgi:hypothetical protein